MMWLAEQAKDVEACMWKSVFYKPIEEFRKRIRKAQESGASAIELLQKATKTLQSFLTECIAFYKLLVMRLQVRIYFLVLLSQCQPNSLQFACAVF
jgi:hypothetical protein